MAFSKKGKRKITVDGKEYYWSAKGGDNYISLTIMADVQGGSRLISAFDYHHIPVKVKDHPLNMVILTNQFIITPYIVRQVIEYALSHNWKPFEKGDNFYLESIDNKIDLRLDKNRANNFKNK